MKLLAALALFALSLATKTFAQTEFTHFCGEKDCSQSAIAHITDNTGNVYLLASKYQFFPGPGMPIEGSGVNLYLYKFDTAGRMLWQQNISPNLSPRIQGAVPGELKLTGNMLFIPLGIPGECHTEHMNSPTNYNAGILVNTGNGSVYYQKAFRYDRAITPCYVSDSCPDLHFINAFTHKDNSVTYLDYIIRQSLMPPDPHDGLRRYSARQELIVEERDDTLGFIGAHTYYRAKGQLDGNVYHDSFTDQFIVCDTDGLHFFNKDWTFDKTIIVPTIDEVNYPGYTITYNKDFYVVNYGLAHYEKTQSYKTAVYTKNGILISVKESPRYEVLNISGDNIIFAVPPPNKFTENENTNQSLTLVRMDLRQKLISEQHIGKPHLRLKCMTLHRNELLITGTYATSQLGEGEQKPDVLFVYRERIDR